MSPEEQDEHYIPALKRLISGFGTRLCQTVACLPCLTLLLLYLFAWRASVLIHHWPLVSRDDPKYIGPHDALYQILDSLICYNQDHFLGLLPLMGLSFFVFPILLAISWNRITRFQRMLLPAMYYLGLLALIIEPGSRLAWYID